MVSRRREGGYRRVVRVTAPTTGVVLAARARGVLSWAREGCLCGVDGVAGAAGIFREIAA